MAKNPANRSWPVQKNCSPVKEMDCPAKKPANERKVAFILNNNPCANADANIGAATHLDSLESVAHILIRMKEAGYSVDPPESGKALIARILERKTVSEPGGLLSTILWQRAGRSFRWMRPHTALGLPRFLHTFRRE